MKHLNRLILGVLVAGLLILGGAQGKSVAAAAECTVTLDPGDDIQAAIDAVSSGDVICLNPGLYSPPAKINVHTSVTLQGPQAGVDPRPSAGTSRTPGDTATEAIIDGTAGGLSGIMVITADNVILDGLEVGNGSGDLIDSETSLPTVSTVLHYNIVHDSSGDEGIQLRNVAGAQIEYNHIYATGGDGINLCCGSTGGTIRFNEVHDISSPDAAIYIYDLDSANTAIDVTIQCNRVYDVYNNEGIKLGAKHGEDASDTGGSILYNTVYNTGQDGIAVYTSDTLVEGNEVHHSASENGAIYVAWGVSNITIARNDVHDNVLNTTKWDNPGAIMIGTNPDASTIHVNENNLYGNSPNGVTNKAAALLDALHNWWGDPSGPSGSGPGSGDSVSDNVGFSPWLVEPQEIADPCAPDNQGPLTSDVVAFPNPVSIEGLVEVTALVDDTNTGGSTVTSAGYALYNDDGDELASGSMSGVFDGPMVHVSAQVQAPGSAGLYDLCVWGTDEPGNVGAAECILLVVYDPTGGFVTGGGWIDSPAGASPAMPALVWDQGFEIDDSGWLDSDDDWYGTVSRVPSSDSGILSSDGDWHAVMQGDIDSAPFSRFDGYRDTWPGSWSAEIDVYLDPNWPAGQGFDYSVAASGSDGDHQRDFIFHVTQDTSTGKLLVAGSNNTNFAPREDLENIHHYEVTTAGWYTLQHVFYESAGALAVDLNLLDESANILFTETRFNAADLIPDEVGGNRYAWFTFINVEGGIAVDDHQLNIPVAPTGKATFGFVAKYKKGAQVPEGNTEFQFQAAELNFHSTSYDWLVVTGGGYARFKGAGTINGRSAPNGDPYKFMLWAGDGTGSNGEDTFRIKIWWEEGETERVVYDNGMDQAIGSGSIVVHTKK